MMMILPILNNKNQPRNINYNSRTSTSGQEKEILNILYNVQHITRVLYKTHGYPHTFY